MASSTPRSTPSAERGRGGEETQQTRCWKAWNMQAFSHTLCRCTIWWDVTAQLLSSRGTQISSVIKLVSLANANGGLEKKSGCVSMVNQDFMQNKNAICVSCWCPATYIWIHIKKTQPNSFSCTASQSELVCLSKLGPAHVCGLLWFTVWGRWRTGCHFPRGTPPLLHFLIDLTDRHFQVSNYHCGAELIPPSSLPLSPGPSMKHTANCSIALLMTQSVQNKGEQRKVETKLMW